MTLSQRKVAIYDVKMQICTSYENVLVVESNSTRPLDEFLYCLGCPHEFLVISDNQMTMNMDP